MKLNTTDFGRRCQFPIQMAAGGLPVSMILCATKAPGSVRVCLILAGIYIALAWLCTLTPGKLRVPVGVLCAAGMAAACAAMLPWEAGVQMALIPVLYAVMLLGGLQVGGWAPGKELHPMVGSVGLVLHMAAQFLVNVDAQNRAEPIYALVTLPLTVGFLVFAAMSLLALNRSSLNSAVNGRSNVPTSMRRKNRLLTAGLMALVLAVASLPAVIRAIERVWEWIKYCLWLLVQFIMNLFPEAQSGGTESAGGGMEALTAETAEQSLLSKILEMILLLVGVIIIVVLVIMALRIVWRRLKVLLKVLWERLNAYMVSSSEDYVDEISDTRDGADHERSPRRSRRRLLKRRIDESALNPQERIRYRYLQAWLRHPEWTPERTARENISADAADLYERARYSSHEVTEREAEAFAQTLDSRKG